MLDSIGLKYGTDKSSSIHDYLKIYERRLSQFQHASFTLIEVGVYHGGSVKTWGEYFPNATIVGLDINPECTQYAGGNVHIRIGDASRSDFLFDVISEFGRPTIFIDDGSHRWDHQITTLQLMFPLLIPGGIYICEDIDTSFEAHLLQAPFQGLSSISAFDYLAKLARCVTAGEALGSEAPYDLFISDFHRSVGSVEFARRTALLSKKVDEARGPI